MNNDSTLAAASVSVSAEVTRVAAAAADAVDGESRFQLVLAYRG